MSLASRRTWQQHRVARFHLTVETEPVAGDCDFERHHDAAQVVIQLVELLDVHRLPATWAVCDPRRSTVNSLVTLSEVRHELALLGDRHWVGPAAGRTNFARELVRCVSQNRAAGVELVTLVPRVAPVVDHLDLLVKHGIRAVVSPDGSPHGLRPAGPRTLHYGVWEFAVTERLPLRSSWMSGGGWTLARRVRRAVSEAGAIHLVIDAAAHAQRGRGAMDTLDWLLRRVAQLRNRGLLQVETLAAAAARLSDLPAAKPQRSILRIAA